MPGMPWGYGPKQFDVEAGKDVIVRLDVPHRGTIKAINLNELGGASLGVFEIYDSQNAAAVFAPVLGYGSSSSSVASSVSSEDVEGGDPAAHSITAGEVAIEDGQYRANNLDIPYINRDGTPTNPVRRLWMRINLAGAGIKTISLGMTIEPAPLNT